MCVCERERVGSSTITVSVVGVLHNSDLLFPHAAAFGRRKEKILQLAGAFSFAFTKLFQADMETNPPGTVLLFVCHGRLLLSAVEN